MKSKAILRSVAVMMSLLTVLPCFGNAAFAMDCNEKKEGQPLAQRRADSTEKVKKKNLETVRIFNQLAESLTKGEITDKKVNSFLNRMENDPLVKPYLNYVDEKFISQEFSKNKMTAIISPYVDVVDEEFKENIRVNHLENNRMSLYMFYLSYLIKKLNISNSIMLGKDEVNFINIDSFIKDMFFCDDFKFQIFFKAGRKYIQEAGIPNPEDALTHLRFDFFKGKKVKPKDFYSFLREEKEYVGKISPELEKKIFEGDNIFLKNDYNDVFENDAKVYVVKFSFLFQYLKRYAKLLKLGISNDFYNGLEVLSFKAVKSLAGKYEKSATQFYKIGTFNDFKNLLKSKQKKKKMKQEERQKVLLDSIKKYQPEAETRNKEQEQKREEEKEEKKEQSKNTKENESTQLFNVGELVVYDSPEDCKERAAKKAADRKKAAKIAENQKKEKEKEKEKEEQKKREDAAKRYELQMLPSDGLCEEQIDGIFGEERKDILKKGKYTKIFTAGENGATKTVYFPFNLLNNIEGSKKQKENIEKDIKKMVYNISRLPDVEFPKLVNTYTGVTLSDFLKDNFTENVQKCFTNSEPECVYRYKINNKFNVVFIKKGNEIVVFNFLEHIYNGRN